MADRGSESMYARRVAIMHFIDRETNLTIAEKLGISRFRVAKLIDLALESGIVSITIASPSGTDSALAEALQERFALPYAIVVDVADADARTALTATAEAAARHVQEVLTPGGVLGMAWGSTLDAVVAAFEGRRPWPAFQVVQLIGGIPSVDDTFHATDLLRRLSLLGGGRAYLLHAPLIVPDATTAGGLRREPSVKRTLHKIDTLDIALLGIGSWRPPASRLYEVMSPEDRAEVIAAEAVADICGVLVDRAGRVVAPALAERMIGATPEQLRACKHTVAVVSGPAKVEATAAVLRSRLLDALVIDSRTATEVLAQPVDGSGGRR